LHPADVPIVKETPLSSDTYHVVIKVETTHVKNLGTPQQVIAGKTTIEAFGSGGNEWDAYSAARESGVAQFENALSTLVVPGESDS
jgi:hypothetical protein